jgi:hypothetical protein
MYCRPVTSHHRFRCPVSAVEIYRFIASDTMAERVNILKLLRLVANRIFRPATARIPIFRGVECQPVEIPWSGR